MNEHPAACCLKGFLCLCVCRLEEQEKLVTAEGLYRRALSLDGSSPEAQEALHKITDTIQVRGTHTHTEVGVKFAGLHTVLKA